MVKKLFFGNWLVLALLLVPTLVTAQGVDSQQITQYDLKDFDWVDICYNPRYAIVTKDGKKGIYDMIRHRNITEIEFRELGYSRQTETEDTTDVSMFYAKKGIKQGVMAVSESTDDIISIWMDDPDEVYSLVECTTIDRRITKRAKKMLETFILEQKMDNAQLVILDAKSGRLKTWIALEANMEKEDAGKLLVHSCSGSLTKPFYTVMALEKKDLSIDSAYNGVTYREGIKSYNNEVMHQAIQNGYHIKVAERKWQQLSDTHISATNPFIMAVGYNSLANGGKMVVPTMKADSVEIDDGVFSPSTVEILRDVLMVDRMESPLLSWLSTQTDWMGYATEELIYAEDQSEPIGKQIQFAGLFPLDNPRYTICLAADKRAMEVSPVVFQDIVNPLMRWLMKR